MQARLFLWRNRIYSSGFLLSSPLLAYSLCPRSRVLLNDSGGQWKGLFTSSSQLVDAKTNSPQSSTGLAKKADELDHQSWFEDDDGHAWSAFSRRFSEAGSTISSVNWSSVGDKIADFFTPGWAKVLPGYVKKLQLELSQGPGSLAEEILEEAEDPYINPEVTKHATVRISQSLCDDEKAFREKRKHEVAKALARYLDVPEGEVHPDDVPVIAMCGSGGGLRALIAGASSYLSTQENGLLDCVTYTAGVSGSCWQQILYHSTLTHQNYQKLIDHLKKRLGVHIAFPPAALQLLTSAPTNKYLLSGLLEKSKSDPDADFGLVDIYGLLLAARLLVPRGELEVHDPDLKLSNQRTLLQNGQHPMPIYTAVRHEIPLAATEEEMAKKGKKATEELKEKAKQEAWFQWFEWSPYEFWSEEIGAGVPTWSLGRKFKDGTSVPRESGYEAPELRLPNLLGIWGSAFCATLSHYYQEIRPLVKGITGFSGIDDLITGQNEELVKVHPIDPGSIPNYACGLDGQLPPTCPKSILGASHLQLMDAGMSNNLPIYPLLRPGRDVDVLIAFDASADVRKDNWLSVVDGYARQRGIKGWPIGVGWPPADEAVKESARKIDEQQAQSPDEAANKVSEAREADMASKKQSPAARDERPLGYCTVWIGSAEERSAPATAPHSKRVESNADWEHVAADSESSGLAVVYYPFIANPKVEGVDPETSDFMSTWNFIYTPEQIDKVVALARANFEEGKEQTRRTVRAVYERKKKVRLEREDRERRAWEAQDNEERKKMWTKRLKRDGNSFS